MPVIDRNYFVFFQTEKQTIWSLGEGKLAAHCFSERHVVSTRWMYLSVIITYRLTEFDYCIRLIDDYWIRYERCLPNVLFVNNLNASEISLTLCSCRLIFLLLTTRCISHCFSFSFSFFSRKKLKRHRKRSRSGPTPSCARALTFLLVSKQHNAACIQRYKTIGNDDDKKKKKTKKKKES